MLDTTKSRLPQIDEGDRPAQPNLWRQGTDFRTFVEKVRQRRRMVMVLMLVGAVAASLLVLAYVTVRVPAYSASSEILISNTTLQLSGQDAVVTQVLVENSLIQSAIEVLRSGKVLERVIDKLGLDEIERIAPRSHIFSRLGLHSDEPPSEASRRQAAIVSLRSMTSVKRVGSSQIISVRARAVSAVDASRLTNAISAAFVQELYQANAVITTSAPLRERIKVLGPTARIVNEAIPPKSKDSLPATVILLLAMILGGALGAGSGLTVIAVDRRLRAAEQVAAVTSVECFGLMPVDGQPSLSSETNDDDSSLTRTSLRAARSAVLESSTKAPRIIGVTSCNAREGKSNFANRLARFLAHDNAPVLLIDASCPDVACDAVQGRPPGLDELLRGRAALEDLVLDNIRPNLDFLPSGKSPGDLDLVWTNLIHTINDGHERCYEWIILDLPPLSRAIDVRSAGQIIDDLIVVAEWGRTSESELGRALGALGPLRDRVLGTVLTKARGVHPKRPATLGWLARFYDQSAARYTKNSHDQKKIS